jgi:hypothetical protein
MVLRATANVFVPFSHVGHVIKRRVSWHPKGITAVRCFTIESCEALPTRELVGVPISEIKNANSEESNPFRVSETIDEQLVNLEKRLEYLQSKVNNKTHENCEEQFSQRNALEDMVDDLLDDTSPNPVNWDEHNPGGGVTIFSYTKGEMAMWCE